jgi:hypothetical protein
LIEACHGCGWQVEGGFAGCRARFEEAIARDFSNPLYFRSHRLTVDTYCLQHPDEYCASAKSLAAHLAGLCDILEKGASAASGSAKLQQWLNGNRDISKPEMPRERGSITIGDLPFEAEPGPWADAVRRWADETWRAYEPLHALARQWLGLAMRDR